MAYIKRKRRAIPKRKRARKRRNPSYGKHRPVLRYTKSGWKRPKKSRLMGRPVKVNPKRKRRVSRKRRAVRRNPQNIMKALTSRKLIMTSVKIGGGMLAGSMAMPVVYRLLPENMRTQGDKFLGLFHVLIGGLVSFFVRNKDMKELGMVIAGTGVYDLVAMNATQLSLPPLPRTLPFVDDAFGAGQQVSASYTPRPALAASYTPRPALAASYTPEKRSYMSASYDADMLGAFDDSSGADAFDC